MKKIFHKIEQFIFANSIVHNYFNLLKLLLNLLILSHLFACFWYFIGTNVKNEETWISKNNYTEKSEFTKYLTSYYFVIITMITVGYGDISPVNNYEKIFSIFFVFIACGIFAYSLNSIGAFIQEIYQSEKFLIEDISTINGYLKRKKIPYELGMRIQKYLEYKV